MARQFKDNARRSRLGTVRFRTASKYRPACRPLLTLSDSGAFDPAPRIPYRMSSFVSRGAVLASARLLNQALALLSPLLLVRLLEISEYGRYRQFMATAMFITSLAGFALSANLNYLIARSPERAVGGHHQHLPAHAGRERGERAHRRARSRTGSSRRKSPTLGCCSPCTCSCSSISRCWCRTGWRIGKSVQVMGYTLADDGLAPRHAARRHVTGCATSRLIFVTIVCAEALKNLWIYVWLRATRPAGVPLGSRGDARADPPGRAARRRLGALQDQRLRQGGGRQADGPRATGYLHHGRLPGAAGQHRAGRAGGRDLPRHGEALAEGSGAGPAAVEARAGADLRRHLPGLAAAHVFRRAAGAPAVHRRLRRGDALLPGVPAADGAAVLPVLDAAAQRRGQRLVRARQSHRARSSTPRSSSR